MNEMWWEGLSPEERLLAEQAVMQYRALRKACAEAPDGSVLSVAERLAVDEGRKLTRRTLEQALQAEAVEAQKKGAPAEAARAAARRARIKGARPAR
jgi:hypothetical protein